MGLVAGRELQLIGSHGFAADDLPHLLQMVSSGRLDPLQLVEKEVSLEEGARTLEAMDKTSPTGMTIITDFDKAASHSKL
jgi:alcohol dehydrogenase